jgi:YbbR domain-containing protein
MSYLKKIWNLLKPDIEIKLISILIGIILWEMALSAKYIEVTKEVPIEISHSKNLIVSNEIPDKISFRLSGQKHLLKNLLSRHEDPIRINLSNANSSLVTYRFFQDQISIPSGVKVLSIYPNSLLIHLEELKVKEVPIRIQTEGSPDEGYVIDKIQVKPKTVRIQGASSKLNNISEISTHTINLFKARASFEVKAPIDFSKYDVKLAGQIPKLFIDIHPRMTNFKIKNVKVHVFSSHEFTVEPDTMTLLVKASAEVMNHLDEAKIFGVIDLRSKAKGTYKQSVQVKIPENIHVIKSIPEKLTVTLY